MSSYLRRHVGPTPASTPLAGQVKNDAGGHFYEIDPFAQLRRFLVLGTEGGTYYAGESRLTNEARRLVQACFDLNPKHTVEEIVKVSVGGLAPRNDQAVFALAIGASSDNKEARKRCLDALPSVCRTGTHLFMFVDFVTQWRGWGRSLRKGVAHWYTSKDVDKLAYQMVKYRQRHGWTHRDVLRSAHPKAVSRDQAALFDWACGRGVYAEGGMTMPQIVEGYEIVNSVARNAREVAQEVLAYGLPREAIPTQYLNDPLVQEAMLPSMPITALVRNLGNMSKSGLLTPHSEATRLVIKKLIDPDLLRRGRVHPFNVLVAMLTYASGHGLRGSGTWPVVTEIVDALDESFYACFGNVEPLGVRTLVALDISGSMQWGDLMGVPGLTPARAQAAMALITVASNPRRDVVVVGFDVDVIPLSLSPRQRLDDVYRLTALGRGRGTDCSEPIKWAQRGGASYQAIVEYTDNQTWYGGHPAEAITRYRQAVPGTKLVVQAMAFNGGSVADPRDPLALNVAGLDLAAPQIVAEFVRGS